MTLKTRIPTAGHGPAPRRIQMFAPRTAALALAAAAWALSGTGVQAQDATRPIPVATAPTAAAALWGHERVGRPADPAVRFGRLPNGLRYALQHNETPKDGVSMRLRIGSGSLQERDDQRGLAHFLEHMAFRGSRQVADGAVVKLLERQGLAFGPDTNAFTHLDQTVYHFNFPRADASAQDTGLMLLREIAEHLTIDPQLVEQEKGVVLSEARARDVPALRALEADLGQLLEGTRVPQRMPIGQVAIIQGATAEKLRAYYQAHYRPDNATLVVVGQIDVDAMERQIRERFGDWKAAAQPGPTEMGRPNPTQPVLEVVADGAPEALRLAWLMPPDLRLPTPQTSREQLVDSLGLLVLNKRLAERALQPGSPYLSAGSALQASVYDVAGLATLQVMAPPPQWRAALDAALQVLRPLLAHGVQPADLQAVLPQVRSMLQNQVAGASNRSHAAIADALVAAAHPRALYQSPQQVRAEAEAVIDTLKPEEVTASLRRLFGRGGLPLLYRSTRNAGVGREALTEQLVQSMSAPVQAAATTATADWPYTDFGAHSAIVSGSNDAALGTTTVQFANGTRLVVKPSTQEKDKVNVQVWMGQGRAGVEARRAHALWALELGTLGGTGKWSVAALQQWQQSSGRLLGVTMGIEPSAFVLRGDTRPADLQTQMQVLAAFARDPGFRPEMGEKILGVAPMLASQFETQPALVYMRQMTNVMNGGEPRLALLPSSADLAATRGDDLAALLRPALAAAADVVIVGDVNVDAAIAAVQATFGAGPARPRMAKAPLTVVPPAGSGKPIVVTHGGRADQAVLGWNWPMPDLWTDPALSDASHVAAAILRSRLLSTVREQLGLTYAPSVRGGGAVDVAGQGSFAAWIETPPEKFDTLRTVLRAQIEALATQAVEPDELLRAKQPMIEDRLKALERNGHWAYWLPRILSEPRMKGAMLREAEGLRAVTAAQVQAFFRDHLAKRAPIEIVARAKEAATPAK